MWASFIFRFTLQWRHNGRNSVSNHQRFDCLFNRLCRRRSKKISKLRVTGLCEGNPPGTGGFPSQRPVVQKIFPFNNAIMYILSIWASNLTVCSPTFIMFTPSGMPWTRPGLSLAVGRPILDCFPQVNTSWKRRKGTVECRYNAVEYNTIMHTPLHWLRQNINQCLHSQKTPHILSFRGELWVVYCEYFGENWPRFNGAALCNAISLTRQCRHV